MPSRFIPYADLAVQAEHAGWRSHAISEFDRDKARAVLGVPEDHQVDISIAISKQAPAVMLSPGRQALKHLVPRNPSQSFVADGRFDFDTE